MEDKRITAEEILAEVDIDVKQMAQRVADAINKQVRDAHAEFRQRTYQKALGLLEKNQQAFSPSAQSSSSEMA